MGRGTQRRNAQMNTDPDSGHPADDVFREAWSMIEQGEKSVFIEWPSENLNEVRNITTRKPPDSEPRFSMVS